MKEKWTLRRMEVSRVELGGGEMARVQDGFGFRHSKGSISIEMLLRTPDGDQKLFCNFDPYDTRRVFSQETGEYENKRFGIDPQKDSLFEKITYNEELLVKKTGELLNSLGEISDPQDRELAVLNWFSETTEKVQLGAIQYASEAISDAAKKWIGQEIEVPTGSNWIIANHVFCHVMGIQSVAEQRDLRKKERENKIMGKINSAYLPKSERLGGNLQAQ